MWNLILGLRGIGQIRFLVNHVGRRRALVGTTFMGFMVKNRVDASLLAMHPRSNS
jgi:hypothetical protein